MALRRQAPMNNKEIVKSLNQLIETCTDGQERFRVSAEKINNHEFRRLFNIFSHQRGQFIVELQTEVHRLGGHPPGDAQLSEVQKQAAQRTGSEITEGDEASIVDGCQRCEESAVNSYQQVLDNELPLDVQYVVKRQYMDIKDAFDRLRILQRAA